MGGRWGAYEEVLSLPVYATRDSPRRKSGSLKHLEGDGHSRGAEATAGIRGPVKCNLWPLRTRFVRSPGRPI